MELCLWYFTSEKEEEEEKEKRKKEKKKKKPADVWFCVCHYHRQQLLTKSKPESDYENIKFKSK